MTVRAIVDTLAAVVPASWSAANVELLELTRERALLEPMLGRIECPVTVVHGTWDAVCPHDGETGYLTRALEASSAVRIVSIARGGHNLHRSHADVVAREIAALARSTPGCSLGAWQDCLTARRSSGR